MKVKALRAVYNRSENKEYKVGDVFETDERRGRALVRLRKVEAVQSDEKSRRRTYRRTDMQADEINQVQIRVEDE